MTEHIDLGDDLADWSEPTRQKPDQPVPDGGSYVPLADLQAAGFNRTPPPGFSYGPYSISIGGGGGQPGGGGSGGSWPGGNGGATFIPPGSLYRFTISDGGSDD